MRPVPAIITRPAFLALLLAQAACTLGTSPPQTPTQTPVLITPEPTPPSVPSCDCDAPETDEGTIARTGFPLGVVWSEQATFLGEGKVRRTVQFRLEKVTMAQVGGAPAKVCAYRDETVVDYSVRDPGPEDRDLPDTMVLDILCTS